MNLLLQSDCAVCVYIVSCKSQTQSNTQEQTATVNFPNVCTALDILTLLLSVLVKLV